MSNEYKEWKRDRAEEAWNSLNSIVEYYEEEMSDELMRGDPAGDLWFADRVKEVLKNGGWI